jgi:hypothetical protein
MIAPLTVMATITAGIAAGWRAIREEQERVKAGFGYVSQTGRAEASIATMIEAGTLPESTFADIQQTKAEYEKAGLTIEQTKLMEAASMVGPAATKAGVAMKDALDLVIEISERTGREMLTVGQQVAMFFKTGQPPGEAMASFVGANKLDLEGLTPDEAVQETLKLIMPQVRGAEGVAAMAERLPRYRLSLTERSEVARQAEFNEEDALSRVSPQLRYRLLQKQASEEYGVTDPSDFYSMFLRGRIQEYLKLQEENPNNPMADLIKTMRQLNETLQKYHPTQGERLDTEGGKVKVGTR